MNNKVAVLVLAVLLTAFFSFNAYAVNTDEYNERWLEESGADKLSDMLNDESRDYLKSIGCEDIDFENIMSLTPSSVFNLIGEMLKNGWQDPFKVLAVAVGVAVLFSISGAFLGDNEKNEGVMNIICACFLVITIFSSALDGIKAASTVIASLSGFEKTLIPVLAVLLTASGNATAAFSVQGTAFAGAQAVETIACDFALPLVMLSGVLGIVGAVLPALRVSALSDLIRKTMSVVLSGASGLFSGFLALKAVLASSADGMAFRGVRFAANTLIPVVGGALSEAFSSMSASVLLMKNTVCIYAIIVMLVIALPVILNLALWIISMKIACAFAELLGASQCAGIIKNAGYVFSMLNVLMFLTLGVFIISVGLVIAIKNGA